MKSKRNKKRGGGACWTANDHAARDERKRERLEKRKRRKLNGAGAGGGGGSGAVPAEDAAPGSRSGGAAEEVNHQRRGGAATGTGGGQQSVSKDEAVQNEVLQKIEARERRTAVLTHETKAKKGAIKLKLHIAKARRDVEEAKVRLTSWDPVAEEERERKEREAAEAAAAADAADDGGEKPKKKKGRKGPESWKLKGAARPAWEVYDFDTRYVDPHVEAHKRAAERARRSVNVLAVYRGRLGDVPALAIPVVRDYLGLLMQLGHLCEEANHLKSARAAWLECVELEGEAVDEPMTTARECLMRMYMRLKRYEAACRLGDKLAGSQDTSAWLRYSLALSSFILKKDSTEQHMIQAIKSNPFCAYYIAYYEMTFSSVMEYTEELDDADDEPQSSLEEAIEYCSKECELWCSSGAAESLRDMLRQASRGRYSEISASDLEWKDRLAKIEAEYDSRLSNVLANHNDEAASEEEDHDNDEPTNPAIHADLKMYANMVRTAMEMLEDSGELNVNATTAIEAS